MGKKTYAVADLHGRYDLLCMALNVLFKFDSGTIVFLGDYIDRGPDSAQILQKIFELVRAKELGGVTRHKYIALRGNHEEIMLETLRMPTRENLSWWIGNGGGATLESFGGRKRKNPKFAGLECIPKDIVEFIKSLPLYYADEYRVFAHAGVEPSTPLEDQNGEMLMWRLYSPTDDPRPHIDFDGTERHIVHGHHQFEDGPKKYAGRTNLDTGAFYTGRLVIAVFDDEKPGGPIEFIEIKGAPDERWS